MSEALTELGALIARQRPAAVTGTVVANGELTVTIGAGHIEEMIEFLKEIGRAHV